MPKINYAKYLNSSAGATSKDIHLFERYKIGDIDLQTCYDEWWLNNKPKLNKREFKNFMIGMGYMPNRKDDDDLEEDE